MTREEKFIPASFILQQLHDQAPAGPVTLQWLMGRLRQQSFGMIILILAIAAAAPGVSVLAGLLLVPSFQMMIVLSANSHSRWIATRELPTRHVGAVVRRAIPILKYLERAIYPRFATPPGPTGRVVGVVIFVLSIRLLLAPLPLSKKHRPRDLHRVYFADLCRTRRFTPYPGAFAGVPLSRRRDWGNLAPDLQCKNRLDCELSKTRRSHSILDSRRTFVAATSQANCRARRISLNIDVSNREDGSRQKIGAQWKPPKFAATSATASTTCGASCGKAGHNLHRLTVRFRHRRYRWSATEAKISIRPARSHAIKRGRFVTSNSGAIIRVG